MVRSRVFVCCPRIVSRAGRQQKYCCLGAGPFMTTPAVQAPLNPFAPTQEQQQLRKEIRDFANREILPNVMKWDEASEFPVEVVKQLGQMGLLGMLLPAEYGGAELGYVEYVLAVEELSAVDGSIGIIVASHNSLCTNHIFLAGNEE